MTTEPRIYVADLAAYNAGYLHGDWITLNGIDSDDVYAIIRDILAEGTRKFSHETLSEHEEWAIHDYEGFGPIQINEYDRLDDVLAHAEHMAEDPGKYFAWMSDRPGDEFRPDLVEGPYASASEWFDRYLEDYYGSLDLEQILTAHGLDPRISSALTELLTFISAEQFELLMSANVGISLVEVPTGEYSREYYTVDSR